MFDSDKIASKGDIRNSHQNLANEINQQNQNLANEINQQNQIINNKINQMHYGLSQQLNYVQKETTNKVNELSSKLNEQNQKFEDLQQTLENPLATQSNEMRNRAIESFNNNWIEEATEEILKALELNNKDYISYLVLARIYKTEGNFEKTIEHYNKAIKYAAPYDSNFVNEVETEKAITYMEEGRKLLNSSFDEAVKYFDIATKKELVKYNPIILQQLNVEKSLIYYQYGFKEKAFEILIDIEDFIKRNNLNVISNVFYYESIFYLNEGDKEKAFEKLKECFLADLNQENKLLEDELLKDIISNFKEWLNDLKNKKYEEIKVLQTKLERDVGKLNLIIQKRIVLNSEDIQYAINLKKNIENKLKEKPILYIDFIKLKNNLSYLDKTMMNFKQNLEKFLKNIPSKFISFIKSFIKIFPLLVIFILFSGILINDYIHNKFSTADYVVMFILLFILGGILELRKEFLFNYSFYFGRKKILKIIKD